MGKQGLKKRLGYILRKFPVLSETFVLNEILELEAQGNDVHIFALERPNDPKFHKSLYQLNAEVTYVPHLLKASSYWKMAKKARQHYPSGFWKTLGYTLRHANPQLLLRFFQSCYIVHRAKKMGIEHFHAHFATRATTVASLSSMMSRIPYSFTAHAVDIFKETLCRKALKKKIASAAFVVTVSEYNKDYLSKISHCSKEKIRKIHNGIDLDLFKPAAVEKSGPFTFLCVARFVEKKGHNTLVDACQILKSQGMSFRCLLIGKGPLQGMIEKAIKEKDLLDTITILGPRTHDQVLESYQLSHAFTLLCKRAKDGNKDGLPVSIVEALACSIPVITTPMTGNPEVIKDHENGFLVPFESPEKTAEMMKKMILQKELYRSLSLNARPSIVEQFDLKKTVGALAEELQQ